jgi:hypothetical protein
MLEVKLRKALTITLPLLIVAHTARQAHSDAPPECLNLQEEYSRVRSRRELGQIGKIDLKLAYSRSWLLLTGTECR